MNEEKIKELIDMGFPLDEVLDTYAVIKDLSEGELKQFLEDCFK